MRLHAGAEPRLEEERMDVTQGKLALGFRTGGITCWEEDYPALVMCNAVFGATPLSKLFLNVREKRSLCYYASSNLEKMKGLLLVSSGIEFGQYQQARDEILAQLEAVRRGEIEDWELEGAPAHPHRRAPVTLDDQSRLEEFWLGQTAAGLDTGIEELVEGLKAVTPGAGGRRRPKAGAGHRLFPQRKGGLRIHELPGFSQGGGADVSGRCWRTASTCSYSPSPSFKRATPFRHKLRRYGPAVLFGRDLARHPRRSGPLPEHKMFDTQEGNALQKLTANGPPPTPSPATPSPGTTLSAPSSLKRT